jgi:hypothetical protein
MASKWLPLELSAVSPRMGSLRAWFAARKLGRILKYAGALAIPGGAFWWLSKPMLSNAIGYDEQFFMWGGWSILKGLAPYRDFIEFKPPMTFLSHALALKLFGYQGQHFRYLFLVLALVSVLVFVGSLIKRGADVVLSSAFGLAIVQLFVNPYFHEAFLSDTESIGLSYYLLGVACLIANSRFRKAAEIAGGIFMTCCVFSKEPFAPCVLSTWAACYFVVHGRLSRVTAIQYLKYTAIGVSLAIVALCSYMVPIGAMSSYIATVRSYTTMFRDPQKGYCVVLGRFHPRGFFEDLPQQWSILHGQFVNVAMLGFLAPFFAASFVFLPRRSWVLFASSLLAVVSAVYAVTVSNCYALHYYMIAQSGLFFFLAMGLDSIGPRLALSNGGMRAWIRWAVLLAMAVQIWPRIETASGAVIHEEPPPEPALGLFDYIREHSAPTDKIFTTGPPSLYVYTDRIAAVRESSIIDELIPALPGNTDEEKLRPLYDELVKNQPKIVFLDPEHGNRKYRHLGAAIMPFLTRFQYIKVNEQLYLRP